MNQPTRQYKTATKTAIAQAYGFNSYVTIVNRIDKLVKALQADDSRLKTLGEWRGRTYFLPDQVKVIVELLGTPETPATLYVEIK